MAALEMIRERVRWCEVEGVDILLCPEGVLGGLADDVAQPSEVAIDVENGDLARALQPLSSATVTTIVGFSETRGRALHNSAAVYWRGAVSGIYRKRHPARRVSVYSPGTENPLFEVGGLRFGIMICNDTNFPG